MSVTIQTEPFDVARETLFLQQAGRSIGALVTFIGLVRDMNDGAAVDTLFLEHYPGMAEKEIEKIIDAAKSLWPLESVRVIHRVGDLKPTDPIVFVGVASQHRGDAFDACEYVMDYLKTNAPFWKKEVGRKKESTGLGGKWLDARQSDMAKQQSWE